MDFGGPQDLLLAKLMSASALRARVIANNISNQNVPGFKRQVVRFEEFLSEHLESGRPGLEAVEPQVVTDLATPPGPDGNNVSMEVENSAMRENRLLYELYSTILQGRMDMLHTSIREGR